MQFVFDDLTFAWVPFLINYKIHNHTYLCKYSYSLDGYSHVTVLDELI